MENADALDLSKENIHPLKGGRNTIQLGLALQAQTDAQAQHMLLQTQEWYEQQIRVYQGSDPLQLWCDYISWVEQSFPKHGPEGHLHLLLSKCFNLFRGEERYKNDLRFVRLCLKMVDILLNQLEWFSMLHNEGIGTTSAEFYCSWAYFLQAANDWQRADLVFRTAMKNMAQPADQLLNAHKRFLTCRDNTLGQNCRDNGLAFGFNGVSEGASEIHLSFDHRQPMSALKAMGKKSAAPHVRVGPNVKSHVPGTLPISEGPSGRSNISSRSSVMRGNNAGPIPIYQERSESEPEYLAPNSALPVGGPVPQSINKENEKKPGPWTGQGSGQRKHQSTSGLHSVVPRHPGFEVHKDEDASNGFEVLLHGSVVPNALKIRKGLEDGFQDAMCIFEEPNPNMIPMYPKSQVYAGGKEFQLEELRALNFFLKKAQRDREMQPQHEEMNQSKVQSAEIEKKSQYENTLSAKSQPPGHCDGFQEIPSNALQSISSSHLQEQSTNNMLHQSLSGQPSQSVERPANHVASVFENIHMMQHHQPAAISTSGSERGSCSSTPGSHSNSEHGQLRSQSHTSHPSNQSVYNQSMTVHTKLAMHEVGNLWESPCHSKSVVDSSRTNFLSNLHQEAKKPSSFQICRDDSMGRSLPAPNSFHCEERPVISDQHVSNIFKDVPEESIKISPLRMANFQIFSGESLVEGGVQSPLVQRVEPSNENKMETTLFPPSEHRIFKDPPTVPTYSKNLGNFHVYREGAYDSLPVVPSNARDSFQVFCDEAASESSAPGRTSSMERITASSQGSGSSIQKIANIAKEKENMHKFPQADVELMEECGTALTSEELEVQHMDLQLFSPEQFEICPTTHQASTETYQPVVNQTDANQFQSAPEPLSSANAVISHQSQEPMDDDATVSSAAKGGVDLSETGITQAFFFPSFGAASTPFRNSNEPKKHSNPIKEAVSSPQPAPSESPARVPPLKLYRIRDSFSPGDPKHLNVILETSKEKHGSATLSGITSSPASSSRYAMYTTQRQSAAFEIPSQLSLSMNRDSSEPLSQSRNVEVQAPAPTALSKADLTERLSKGNLNPFDSRLLSDLLSHIGFPLDHHVNGYFSLNGCVPAKRNNCLNLGGESFKIAKVLGEGAYAKVLKGVHIPSNREVALKVQKPSCKWEYYICREIQHRLSNQNLALAFMNAEQIYVYSNGSVIVTDLLRYGTLLTLLNKVVASTKRVMLETQALFLIDQLISALTALHKCKIIHGDLKPDNVLLRSIPFVASNVPCIQLIDFGRSIDMSLMPHGTTFNQIVMTDTFTCIEMQTGRPWTYQTDLYGLANIAHCLLLGDYMKIQESRSTGRYTIQTKLPRNVNSEMWLGFFDALLNVESCDAIPDLDVLKADILARMNTFSSLKSNIANLGNIMMER